MAGDLRPVLIGMNNPLSTRPEHALFPYPVNCTGWRIWRMLGDDVRRSDYLRTFDRRNLLSSRDWSREKAGVGAAALRSSLIGRRVVVLGAQTASALDLPFPRLTQLRSEGATFWVLPHPSGRCRWYNDEENRRRAARLLRRLYDDYQQKGELS